LVRLAVVSDTHGNRQLLSHALSLARAGGRVDAMIHLGDEHTDIQGFASGDEEVIVVPGLQHPEYGSATAPVSRIHQFGGLTVAMAHQPSDIPSLRESPGPRLFLHGHTHSLALSVDPWGVRFNPGHLARPTDRGRPASFGVVEIHEDRVMIRGVSLEGDALLESSWPAARLRRDEA